MACRASSLPGAGLGIIDLSKLTALKGRLSYSVITLLSRTYADSSVLLLLYCSVHCRKVGRIRLVTFDLARSPNALADMKMGGGFWQ